MKSQPFSSSLALLSGACADRSGQRANRMFVGRLFEDGAARSVRVHLVHAPELLPQPGARVPNAQAHARALASAVFPTHPRADIDADVVAHAPPQRNPVAGAVVHAHGSQFAALERADAAPFHHAGADRYPRAKCTAHRNPNAEADGLSGELGLDASREHGKETGRGPRCIYRVCTHRLLARPRRQMDGRRAAAEKARQNSRVAPVAEAPSQDAHANGSRRRLIGDGSFNFAFQRQRCLFLSCTYPLHHSQFPPCFIG